MSAIASIYDAIEAWECTYDGDTDNLINCWDIDEWKNQPGDTPFRYLGLPESAEFVFPGAMGSHASVEWIIKDTFYLKPVAEGEGLVWARKRLRDYCGYYIEQARLNRSPTGQSEILAISFTPREDLTWPEGGGPMWFGVDCFVTVREQCQT